MWCALLSVLLVGCCGWLVGWLLDVVGGLYVACIAWLVDGVVGVVRYMLCWLVVIGRLCGLLVGWCVGWLVGRSVCWLVGVVDLFTVWVCV